MRWFGRTWGAPCCKPENHCLTPIGKPCYLHTCFGSRDTPDIIQNGDQGFTWPMVLTTDTEDTQGIIVKPIFAHLDCFLCSITGKHPGKHDGS